MAWTLPTTTHASLDTTHQLARLVFCFSATTLHHGFQFPVTNTKGSLCIWKRFMVRQCNFGHHHLFGFDSQPVPFAHLTLSVRKMLLS
ncbi:predicted protein [Lichtheimia corymbifera JMRC:FSU:9682]|uniref:Uncharacterized protein n=1 Tax=Lichtheimia corymbifera JMRC:FSU:9682 TaxID=1263082 RepID=A0A068RH52_9FUNG|nr:predicted protein [Lichtheimia corymbifera JMRC:FSU:9682]